MKTYRGVYEDEIPVDEALTTDIIPITHQLEVLRIPLELQPLDFDFNYLGNVAIVGHILCDRMDLAQ